MNHMNFDVVQFCNSKRIQILNLPSHPTQVLQLLALVVFSAFRNNYSVKLMQHHGWDGVDL